MFLSLCQVIWFNCLGWCCHTEWNGNGISGVTCHLGYVFCWDSANSKDVLWRRGHGKRSLGRGWESRSRSLKWSFPLAWLCSLGAGALLTLSPFMLLTEDLLWTVTSLIRPSNLHFSLKSMQAVLSLCRIYANSFGPLVLLWLPIDQDSFSL